MQDEAEADLAHGFRAWLQGTHPENRPTRNPNDVYVNEDDGRPHRRKMDGTRYPSKVTEWKSTPWGDAQLTHLPGVREWLRTLEHYWQIYWASYWNSRSKQFTVPVNPVTGSNVDP